MGSTGKASNVVQTVITPDGIKIGVGDYLLYGKDSGHAPMPKSVIDFENKRKFAKIEFGLITKVDGTALEEKRGSKGRVALSRNAFLSGDIMTHNHPRTGDEESFLGGTFSFQDLDVLSRSNIRTLRAATNEGTYSLSRGSGFNGVGLAQAYNQFETTQQNAFSTARDAVYQKFVPIVSKIKADYHNGKITYTEVKSKLQEQKNQYLNEIKTLANKDLIDAHNWLLANQKKYGYTYGLER